MLFSQRVRSLPLFLANCANRFLCLVSVVRVTPLVISQVFASRFVTKRRQRLLFLCVCVFAWLCLLSCCTCLLLQLATLQWLVTDRLAPSLPCDWLLQVVKVSNVALLALYKEKKDKPRS